MGVDRERRSGGDDYGVYAERVGRVRDDRPLVGEPWALVGEDGSMMPAVLDDSKRQSVSGPLEAALLTFYLIEHRSPQPWVTRFVIA